MSSVNKKFTKNDIQLVDEPPSEDIAIIPKKQIRQSQSNSNMSIPQNNLTSQTPKQKPTLTTPENDTFVKIDIPRPPPAINPQTLSNNPTPQSRFSQQPVLPSKSKKSRKKKKKSRMTSQKIIRDDISVCSKASRMSRMSRLTGRNFKQVDPYRDFFLVEIKDKKNEMESKTSKKSRIGKLSRRNSRMSCLTQNKQIFSTHGVNNDSIEENSKIENRQKALSVRDNSLENHLNGQALSFKDIKLDSPNMIDVDSKNSTLDQFHLKHAKKINTNSHQQVFSVSPTPKKQLHHQSEQKIINPLATQLNPITKVPGKYTQQPTRAKNTHRSRPMTSNRSKDRFKSNLTTHRITQEEALHSRRKEDMSYEEMVRFRRKYIYSLQDVKLEINPFPVLNDKPDLRYRKKKKKTNPLNFRYYSKKKSRHRSSRMSSTKISRRSRLNVKQSSDSKNKIQSSQPSSPHRGINTGRFRSRTEHNSQIQILNEESHTPVSYKKVTFGEESELNVSKDSKMSKKSIKSKGSKLSRHDSNLKLEKLKIVERRDKLQEKLENYRTYVRSIKQRSKSRRKGSKNGLPKLRQVRPGAVYNKKLPGLNWLKKQCKTKLKNIMQIQ